MGDIGMTERQKKWFATVQANFEKQTGRPVAVWVDILKKGCPDMGPKKQAAWLKATHGIGANHAAYIISSASPEGMGWDDPAALRDALWNDPQSLAILEAIERTAGKVDGVVAGQRKGYTSFSRSVQFAATRPLKGGKALLGLKLDPSTSERLSAPTRTESWSERLTSVVELDGPGAVNAEIAKLFAMAAENG